MARKLRLYYPGAIYHVMLRGNAGENIFYSDQDRKYFYSLLQEGVQKFNYKIHAFCLMTNHFHLALQMGDIHLSKAIHNFSFRYAKYINKIYSRKGHVFQGRHHSILIDTEAYFLELIRYIHFNPVRAKLVQQAEEYPWSSHNGYLGYEYIPWLTCDALLKRFSNNVEVARNAYKNYMNKDVTEILRRQFQVGNQRKSSVLADDKFLEKLNLLHEKKLEIVLSLEKFILLACDFYSVDFEYLAGSSRSRHLVKLRTIICWVAQSLKICSLTSVANFFNRDIAALSRSISKASQNEKLRDEFIALMKHIQLII